VKVETPAAATASVSTVAEQTPQHVKVGCSVVVIGVILVLRNFQVTKTNSVYPTQVCSLLKQNLLFILLVQVSK